MSPILMMSVVVTWFGTPIGGALPPSPELPSVSLVSSPIVTDGPGALVIDADSGDLVRVDARGEVAARLAVDRGAATLALDGRSHILYVADRAADRIVVVDAVSLTKLRAFPTREEPYGVALTPDGATLLVTHVAARVVVAYDPSTGAERWSLPTDAEPRNLAVSPDGARAVVTYLASDAVGEIDFGESVPRLAERQLGSSGESSVVRGAMTATFAGKGLLVVAHQIDTPNGEDGGSGYGASEEPVGPMLAFLSTDLSSTGEARAQVALAQPRGIAWDPRADRLFVTGYGDDRVLTLERASQASIEIARAPQRIVAEDGCGPSAVTVGADGVARVWCELSRQVAFLAPDDVPRLSAPVASSHLDASVRRGRSLFRRASGAISTEGMTCASCHPEGRADGLSWTIDQRQLQTPLLAGRLAGTQPYKWDGRDPTLAASIATTTKRLGGAGLSDASTRDLAAYLLSLPPVRVARPDDAAAVGRGKTVFESKAGCSSCHAGPRLTDGSTHSFGDLKVDTPSLIGVPASAPYLHDGSAATLLDVVEGHGSIGTQMADVSDLTDAETNDLVAYLETL